MKRLLLLVSGVIASMSLLAQEDVTHYIQNAGFDEDLTFQVDGTMKEAVSTETSLSNRSWAYIAADSTVYARPKTTSSQNRADGRKMEAVNGFKGRVQGWTLETNGEYPKCEWTYFGTVPYALKNEAVCISDDTNGYMTTGYNDFGTYTERGTCNLVLAENVTFTDGYFLDAAALEAGQKPLIITGIEAVTKAIMESENDSFDALNTELVIENGKVVDIARCYTP